MYLSLRSCTLHPPYLGGATGNLGTTLASLQALNDKRRELKQLQATQANLQQQMQGSSSAKDQYQRLKREYDIKQVAVQQLQQRMERSEQHQSQVQVQHKADGVDIVEVVMLILPPFVVHVVPCNLVCIVLCCILIVVPAASCWPLGFLIVALTSHDTIRKLLATAPRGCTGHSRICALVFVIF